MWNILHMVWDIYSCFWCMNLCFGNCFKPNGWVFFCHVVVITVNMFVCVYYICQKQWIIISFYMRLKRNMIGTDAQSSMVSLHMVCFTMVVKLWQHQKLNHFSQHSPTCEFSCCLLLFSCLLGNPLVFQHSTEWQWHLLLTQYRNHFQIIIL